MDLNELSRILWRERRLMELLVFKLGEEKLVLAEGRTDWLVHASREVDAVAAELECVELERAVLTQSVWTSLGSADAPSLARLAGSAPSPWGRILDEHRRALLDMLDEMKVVARTGRGVPPILPQAGTSSDEQGSADRAGGVAAPARHAAHDGVQVASSDGTLETIVDELRSIGAAAPGERGGSVTAGPSARRPSGDEMARVVAALQIEEMSGADVRPSPIRVIRASLVEFLR